MNVISALRDSREEPRTPAVPQDVPRLPSIDQEAGPGEMLNEPRTPASKTVSLHVYC